MNRYRYILLTVVALASAALAFYYNGDSTLERDGGSFRHEYKLETFQLMHTDDKGAVSFRVSAPTLWKEPGQGKAMIRKPKMDFFASSGSAWKANAASAQVNEDGTLVEMLGQTYLQRLASATAPPLLIESQSLTVYPNDRLAVTDGPVKITKQSTLITGVGLRIDLEDESYEVLSKVRIVESTL